jgi:D-alanyl-D-alanine carboxypeptidase (penicillin-binding protein 5/6)
MVVPRRVWAKRKRRQGRRHYGRIIFGALTFLVISAGVANYARPLPLVEPRLIAPAQFAEEPVALTWPGFGQSAVATKEQGVLARAGDEYMLPIASITKVITSLCILEKYPLSPGQTGPTITLTQRDVEIYNDYIAKDGSVAAVAAGAQLTQYQLLEAIMLPSANNLADTGAIWAYGSLENYFAFANSFLAGHGLTKTKVGVDASGLDAASQSTAEDIAMLGLLAVEHPVLVEIMSKTKTTLPVAGTVYNYNNTLGQNGIFGIKTGNNDFNLGALQFAAKLPVGTETVTITGAVMGASSLREAMQRTVPLVASVEKQFEQLTPVTKGQLFATYQAPWGARTSIVAKDDIRLVRWKGKPVTVKAVPPTLDPNKQNEPVSKVSARHGQVLKNTDLVLEKPLAEPSFWWRLTRNDF